jgi:hypothetical protein
VDGFICWIFGHDYKWGLDATTSRCKRCGVQWWARDIGYGLIPRTLYILRGTLSKCRGLAKR